MRALDSKTDSMTALFWLLDAPLQELYDYRKRGVQDPVQVAYAEAMIGYLSGDAERLEKAIQELSQFGEAAEAAFALDLALLRREIRSRAVKNRTLSSILRKIDARDELLSPWIGEAYCLLGRAHECMERHDQAMRYYSQAHLILESQGCRRKSVRSLMNHLACRSKLVPVGNYISEYFEIVRLARQAGEYGMAGVALMNISRELQASGALPSALRYANRSLLFMSRDLGTLHYYLALINRCHIQLELGRVPEARLDFEEARMSSHREIQAAIPYLESLLNGSKSAQEVQGGGLTVGWRGRVLGSPAVESELAAMENQLVHILSTGPRRKADLICLLWGEREDALSLDFRFKDLIKRIRRKREHLIVFDGEKYGLSPKSFIDLSCTQVRSTG